MSIKISKESMERFNHDKNVVGATNRVPCPINNGADMHNGEMLEILFDMGEYVESNIGGKTYEALGFIDGAAVSVKYTMFTSEINIKTIHPSTSGLIESYRKLLPERLSDEQVEPMIVANEILGDYTVRFFYNEKCSAGMSI